MDNHEFCFFCFFTAVWVGDTSYPQTSHKVGSIYLRISRVMSGWFFSSFLKVWFVLSLLKIPQITCEKFCTLINFFMIAHDCRELIVMLSSFFVLLFFFFLYLSGFKQIMPLLSDSTIVIWFSGVWQVVWISLVFNHRNLSLPWSTYIYTVIFCTFILL